MGGASGSRICLPLALVWATAGYLGAARDDRLGRIGVGANVFLGLFVVQVHFAADLRSSRRRRTSTRALQVVAAARPGAGRRGLALAATIPYIYYVTVVDLAILSRYGQ
ncbi:MAG: hypothetical protein U0703_19700 [Anaerolineae bacterium]